MKSLELIKVLALEKYKHFEEISNDDWRDPSDENSGFSISSKGWFDHRTEKRGKLSSLLEKKITPSYIYNQSTREKTDIEIIQRYFNTRKINIETDLIHSLKMRVNRYKDLMSIITPMFTVDGTLVQLHIIDLDQQYRKIKKSRLLGKTKKDRGILIDNNSAQLLIVEGLEDGVILSQKIKKNIFITGPAVNFKRAKSFIENYQSVTVVLDSDEKDVSMKQSYYLGSDVKRLIPKETGIDANEAIKNGNFNKWWLFLRKVPFSEVEKLHEESQNHFDVVDEMNEQHGVIRIQGKVVILNFEYDPMFKRKDISFSTKSDFMTWYCNKYVQIEDKEGNPKLMTKGNLWLNSTRRREYKGFKFDPLCDGNDDGFLNLWQGWAYEPKKGSCDLYYKHLKDNIAGGDNKIYKYILNWMADAIQNPTKRPGVSLVLRGGSGVGKGVAISTFCKLFGMGRHAMHISDAEQVVGKFNGHLKNNLVIYADEAFYAGDKKHESVLKTLISEDIRMVELKGKDAFQFPNYSRIMMSSNKGWVVPLEFDDRRFFITDVLTGKQNDSAYFKAILDQMDDGGYEALLYDLMHRELGNVNIREYPETKAIFENKLDSMNNIDQWLFDRLKNNQFQEMEHISSLYEDYKNSCGRSWVDTKGRWSRHINKIFGGESKAVTSVQKAGESGRFYSFNDLTKCKILFSKRFRFNIDWS